MPAGICGIDRIAVAVGVGLLVQVGVPGDEPPHLRVVGPAPHQRQPRVPLTPVARRGPVLVGARAAAGTGDRLAECRSCQRPLDGPAAVGDRPLGPQPVEQRRLAVLPNERISVGLSRSLVWRSRWWGPNILLAATSFVILSHSVIDCLLVTVVTLIPPYKG